MLRKIPALLFLLTCSCFVFGQKAGKLPVHSGPALHGGGSLVYGNEWIDTNATYIRFRLAETGVYRVSAASLVAAGWDTTGASPSGYHLIFRGQEIPIWTETSGGALQFIEFFATHNDGLVDSLMYRSPSTGMLKGTLIPHLRYSMFTDTAAYYLTWTPLQGLRYTDYNNTNYSAMTPEQVFRYTAWLDWAPSGNAAYYNEGGGLQYDATEILNSDFTTAEGYVGPEFKKTDQGNYPFNDWVATPHAANIGNPSIISTRVHGQSFPQHILEFRVNGNLHLTDTAYGAYVDTYTAPYTSPIGNTTTLEWRANGLGTADVNRICWAAIEYDRFFNMDAQSNLPMRFGKPTDAYFRLANADITSTGWVYDLSMGLRARGTASLDTLKVILPGAAGQRYMFAVTDKGIKTPIIEAVNPGRLTKPNHNGADFVIITTRALAASAAEYELYRDSCTVNPANATVVYVDEIYEEFGYGSLTTLAIKRFCHYAVQNWNTTPKYFVIWGKGQIETRNRPDNQVPTYGHPASDWEYVSNLDPFAPGNIPVAAISRVNVYNDNDGRKYLDKLNWYEHQPWDPSWMKEGIFLGGGSEFGYEQVPIYTSESYYRNLFSGMPFGGHDYFYQKWNSADTTNSPLVNSHTRINDGVGLIHFFGHSSSNIQDVDIREASLYNNVGKYPFMIAFGCYGGNFTGYGTSFGERYILESDRGAIGYLANSGAGFLDRLADIGNTLYPHLYVSQPGERIGDILVSAYTEYLSASQHAGISDRNHVRQLNLQGDPIVKLHMPTAPDLEITVSDVSFSPANFSASDTAFTVNVVVHNHGISSPQDSFYLSLRQQTPSGAWITVPNVFHGPLLEADTISIVVPNTVGPGMAGLNFFDIFVDSTALVTEYAENNNRIMVQRVVPGNSPAILFPFEYAVVPSPSVKLSASAIVMSNLPVVNYIYEIDEDFTFGSPEVSGVVAGTAVFSEWQVPFQLTDSTVYYWRVRLENVWPPVWATSSFKYIAGHTGWGQSHEPQFFKDGTLQVSMNPTQLDWQMENRQSQLHVWFEGGNDPIYRFGGGAFGSELDNPNWGIVYTVINHRTMEPAIQNTIHGDWALADPFTAQSDIVAAINFMQPGDYLLMVSHIVASIDYWNPQLMTALASLGCDTAQIGLMANDQKFIILARKGFPNQAVEILEPNYFDDATQTWAYDLFYNVQSPWPTGKVYSTRIGPSVNWRELIWDWSSVDPFVNEKMTVNAYAIRSDNTDTLIYSGLTPGNYTLAALDADAFPFMRLEAEMTDSVYLTAPQLDNWYVLFDAAPDAAIDPVDNFVFLNDTVLEGATISVEYSVRNLTDLDMDSLLVKYYVRSANNQVVSLGNVRYDSLRGSARNRLTFNFNTFDWGLEGANMLVIEINPDNDQREMYHFNNLYDHAFYVIPDKVNPLLDVTFNGKHIMDGDYTSSQPEILIQLNDENPFLALNDTAMEVYFGPGTNDFNLVRIPIQNNPLMERIPASLPANKGQLYFRPGALDSGDYTLKIQGFDRNENSAGPVEYSITFKVETRAAVTQLLNYPNPFSSQTRFAYLLTGSELPEKFEVHIYTISGRLVKVIDLAEMGEVRFGYNITDYAWDGRDEYGDLLANGVYIYRVMAKLNGTEMETRDEGINEFFKNGFGKMYIMR